MIKKEIMKKQLNRMKQRANQNLGRAEKTEVLNDELLQCEKRTDQLKHTCQNITKKLSACLIGSGQDVEKRTKKLPYSLLSQSMQDMGSALGETTLLGQMLMGTSEACANIAQELTSHEMGLENLILIPFNTVLEDNIPQIQANKRKLTRLTLDLDSAKNRYHVVSRTTGMGKGNFQEQAAKVDSIKEELDDASVKVEACKDALVTDMLNLVAKESILARSLLDMVEAQAQYHRNALARLENMVPKLKSFLETDQHKPTFGTPLEEHLKMQDREIAAPIEVLTMWILELGAVEEEGIFRIGGNHSKMKLLKAAFDANIELDLMDFEYQEHSIAGVLKQYLRELPEPLLTFQLYEEFLEAGSVKDPNQKIVALQKAVGKLPKTHHDNLKFLCRFLKVVADKSEKNKMNASNLSLVVAPNVLWSEKDDLGTSMGAAPGIVECLITNAETFFPGEMDFPMPTTPVTPKANTVQDPFPPQLKSPNTASPGFPGMPNATNSPPITTTSHHTLTPPLGPPPGPPPNPPSEPPPPSVTFGDGVGPPPPIEKPIRNTTLPRKSVKRAHAPPPPSNSSPTPSPNNSLPRNTQPLSNAQPPSSNTQPPTALAVPQNNHDSPETGRKQQSVTTPTGAAPTTINGTISKPERPPPVAEKPPVREKPSVAEKPTVAEKPSKPNKPSVGPSPSKDRPGSGSARDSTDGTTLGASPPSPNTKPKASSGIQRPTMTPPPPPPAAKPSETKDTLRNQSSFDTDL